MGQVGGPVCARQAGLERRGLIKTPGGVEGGHEEAHDGSGRLVSLLGSTGSAHTVDKAARAASPDRLRAEPGWECPEGLVGWGFCL